MSAKYDELLKYFVSQDDLRPGLQQPSTIGDKTYASNAHILIAIPNDLLEQTYEPHPKHPDFQKVINQALECNRLSYSVPVIEKVIDRFEKVHDSRPCGDCDGEGRCPHCNKECDTCGATGEVVDKRLPLVLPDEDAGVRICDKLFAPKYIELIAKTAKAFGQDSIILSAKSDTLFRFLVGELEITLARLDPEESELTRFQIFDLNPMSCI